jgi:hypothetical protein
VIITWQITALACGNCCAVHLTCPACGSHIGFPVEQETDLPLAGAVDCPTCGAEGFLTIVGRISAEQPSAPQPDVDHIRRCWSAPPSDSA